MSCKWSSKWARLTEGNKCFTARSSATSVRISPSISHNMLEYFSHTFTHKIHQKIPRNAAKGLVKLKILFAYSQTSCVCAQLPHLWTYTKHVEWMLQLLQQKQTHTSNAWWGHSMCFWIASPSMQKGDKSHLNVMGLMFFFLSWGR